MSTCGYDLDINRDLMPKIRQLTDPPATSERVGKYKGSRKIRGKPSNDSKSTTTNGKASNGNAKWTNHEYCDYCREGGDVLCCDRCPSTFHLQCNEPPLEEEEIPEGAYYCRRCLSELKREEADLAAATKQDTLEQRSESTKAEGALSNGKRTEGSNQTRIDYAKREQPPTREAQSTAAVEAMEVDENAPLDKNGNRVESHPQPNSSALSTASGGRSLDNPLSLLIEAAQALNPQQFDLPSDYTSSIPLPGAPKKPATHNPKKKLPHELDNNGLVPFPVKSCFQCRQSCKKAPLIQCDFCPLLYHADCLDPPLTALPAPTSKWICPAHSEHIIDQKLLTSTRLTERVKLWNRFGGRIDENAIKISFLQKVHAEVSDDDGSGKDTATVPKQINEARIRVPESIKNMYRYPADISPASAQLETSDPEVLRVLRRQQLRDNEIQPPTTNEQETYLSALLTLMQSSVSEYMTKANAERSQADEQRREKVNSSIHSWMEDAGYLWKKVDGDLDGSEKPTDQKLPPELVAQGLAEIQSKLAAVPDLSQNDLDEALIDKLDMNFVRSLALQRLRQLVPATKTEDDSDAKLVATCSTFFTRRFLHGDIKARALLCPVRDVLSDTGVVTPAKSEASSFPMRYRSLTIGLGDSNEVVLSNYGYCNFISAKHACIYFDELTQSYELINYSEHGTFVDNILYSLDFSTDVPPEETTSARLTQSTAMPPKDESGPPKKKGSKRKKSRLTKPPKKSNKTKANPVTRQIDGAPTSNTMCAGISGAVLKECDCQCSASVVLQGSGAGYEGPAQLKHGSHIKFGCIQFVFGITAFAASAEEEAQKEAASEAFADDATMASEASTLEVPLNTSTMENPQGSDEKPDDTQAAP